MKGRAPTAVAALSIAVLLLTSGCAGAGPMRTESQTVQVGGAEAVHVEIVMGAGTLLVSGGADQLLEAEFTYSDGDRKPEVEYNVSQGHGRLVIRQPSAMVIIPSPSLRYEWDLRLNSEVPMSLGIEMGAGGGDLDLDDLNLTDLRIAMGAGSAEIDLTGDWERDLKVTIVGGVGGVRLRLPRDIGVRVDVDRGLGTVDATGFRREDDAYVNGAYGTSEVTLRVDVDVGVGGVELELGG